jgi:hypothetical protein
VSQFFAAEPPALSLVDHAILHGDLWLLFPNEFALVVGMLIVSVINSQALDAALAQALRYRLLLQELFLDPL